MRLNIVVTRTRNNQADYVQIASDDQVSVNIVLIADEGITVVDHREKNKKEDKGR